MSTGGGQGRFPRLAGRAFGSGGAEVQGVGNHLESSLLLLVSSGASDEAMGFPDFAMGRNPEPTRVFSFHDPFLPTF